jgi:hypothetical protein
MSNKGGLPGLVDKLWPHAAWETIKYVIFTLAGPTILATSYALWQKARHLSIDWYFLVGIFLVSCALFASAVISLPKGAKKTVAGDEQRVVAGVKDDQVGNAAAAHATLYPEREDLYKDIVTTIKSVGSSQHGQKELLLAGLHGESGPRRTTLLHENPALASFDNEMRNCITSSGPDMWYVRELYNIVDEERLAMILARIRQAPLSEGYEVRAFCVRNPIPQFKPLVVGQEDLFLAVDDPTYYRVSAGMHIRGSGFVSLASTHFYTLWNAQSPQVFQLRTATGENPPGIALLSEAILNLHDREKASEPPKQLASRSDFLRSGIWAVLGRGSATTQMILKELQVGNPADREEVFRLLGVLVEEEKIEADTSKAGGYYRLKNSRS